MGKFQEEAPGDDLGKMVPPAYCKCGNRTTIALANVIKTKSGDTLTGPISNYSFYGKGGRLELKGGLEFSHWSTFCTPCWVGVEAPDHESEYTPEQARYAWRWFAGVLSKAAEGNPLGGLYTAVELTQEQQETALLIVNKEAKRTHCPESVPEEYRLLEVWG